MKNPRTVAAIATVAAAIVLAVLLLVCRLVFDPSLLPQPPRPTTELLEEEEEYVEMLEQAPTPSQPAKAQAPTPARRESHAAQPTASQRQSEIRNRAQKGVSDAFAPVPEADDNTEQRGPDKGNSGVPDGNTSALDGTGTGSVGGGWIMPRYAKVASRVTGRIELRAIIGPDGRVISVEQTGGKAPAAADRALVNKCIDEVRAHRFTRTDDAAPDRATAHIIYTFK